MKGSRNLRRCILGGLNGALYSMTMLLMIWWLRGSAYKRNIAEGAISGDYVNLVSNERWVPIVICWLIAFISANFIVSSLWRKNESHSLLFWEVVGLTAVAVWNGFALFAAWFDGHFTGQTTTHIWVKSWNPLFGPISFAVVIVVNLVYGYFVQAFEPKTERKDNK